MKQLRTALLLLLFLTISIGTGMAQNREGKWTLGLRGGINTWNSDYNQHMVGDGGAIMLGYGITDWFSAGALAGYEELKAQQNPSGATDGYLKLQAIPVAMVGYIHILPNSMFDPYVYAGLGAMLYKRVNGDNVYIPNSKFNTTVLIPMGIGFEVPMTGNLSFVADAGYRVTDAYTDYIAGGLDSYATAKVGIDIRLGSDHVDEETVVPTNTVYVDRPVVVQKTDTVTNTVYVPKTDTVTNTVVIDRTPVPPRDTITNTVLVNNNPIVLEKGKTVVLKGISFETGKATLTIDSKDILLLAYNAMVASPDINVLIVGHTDNVGQRDYNRDLSVRRAKAVKEWMINEGIASSRMTTSGRGMDEPVDVNSTSEGRANNRRIEFRVKD
ncbi:MAG TPA: OmpA family protein [Bacteroidota bacterium]|nr:OmpA family protein [Bacteroidota bacterium]